MGAASTVAAAAFCRRQWLPHCPLPCVTRVASSGAAVACRARSPLVPARRPLRAAHGDTLATRDSPRQCATTRPRVDTPDQLISAAGIHRNRERKFAAERNCCWRKLGLSGQAGGQKCEEEEEDDDDSGWERCGSVKRKAALLLYAEWSSYSAPTLIFQNRRVAYLTVSPHTSASCKPVSRREKCCFGSLGHARL